MDKKIILILVAVFFGLMLLIGSKSGNQPEPIEPNHQESSPSAVSTEATATQQISTSQDENLEDTFKSLYMEGCLEAETTKSEYQAYAYCDCTYKRLREKYSYSELIELGSSSSTDNIPDPILEAAFYCLD